MFLNKKFARKIVGHAVPIKELFIVFSHLGIFFLCLRKRLQKSINKNILFSEIKIIFKSSKQLVNFLRSKDKIPLCFCSNIVHKFEGCSCKATYCGETCRHCKVRVGELSGISPLTNKRFKSKKNQQLLRTICWCAVSCNDLKVLASSNSWVPFKNQGRYFDIMWPTYFA